MIDRGEKVMLLRGRIHEHTRHDWVATIAQREQTLPVYCYSHPCCGFRVWWSMRKVYDALALETPMREVRWRETWWPHWAKRLENIGLPAPPHLRRVVLTRVCIATMDLYKGLM